LERLRALGYIEQQHRRGQAFDDRTSMLPDSARKAEGRGSIPRSNLHSWLGAARDGNRHE
jgi:hypothetical protein